MIGVGTVTEMNREPLVIECDEGHRREYAWPPDVSLLHGAAFADLCVADFEAFDDALHRES